jgi:HEAT repeat protein
MPAPTWNGHEIPRSASVAELASMLRSGPPGCWLAFRALSERYDPAALELVLAETQSADPLRRRAAAEAVGDSAIGNAGVSHIRRLLSDESPIVVRSAADAAAKLRDAGSHDPIVGLLRDRDASTRQAAIGALDELWRDEDFDGLLVIASEDPDERTRREAGFVLKNHASAPRWRSLVELWQGSELPRERAWACDLIGQFGSGEDLVNAARFLRDPDGHVRSAAQRALDAVNERAAP